MSTFRRPISPTELIYFPMRDLAPPFLMQMAFEGDGALDADQLRRAVTVAAEANPGARLIRDGKYWVDSGIAPAVRVVHHALQYPALETDPVLTSPIGPTPESTVEVLLLTADPVTIVFRVFHGVMDGMGMAMFVTDVFRALRGLDPIGADEPVADAELVAQVGAPGRPTLMQPRFRSAVGRGRQDPGEHRHLLRHRTIHATGRGAMERVAAILASEGGPVSRIMIPVDLRRHLPGLRSTANLALPLFIDATPGMDWKQIRDIKRAGLDEGRELNQMDNSGLTALPPAVGRGLARTLNVLGSRAGRNLASATVSHMGRYDLDELAIPGWQPTSVRVLPQHSVAMPLLFAMTECGGRTELTVSARSGRGIPDRLEALLDRIALTLEAELEEPANR
ncbi:peptide synthetase [Nocardia huaxiensis]|uniref:Peptide synthetase n=1 Tax=Nocardia huaxiensis TaxID=2755382 RepID=A0A7D6ZS58_9NOCA|nr:peptide synthetase [Nocardia huaxiensis]QLY32545.1 peptide synthetase [Nocardia huaxiensis]UFS93728.1 peptide synthetase [Nocardia huaxiensis]